MRGLQPRRREIAQVDGSLHQANRHHGPQVGQKFDLGHSIDLATGGTQFSLAGLGRRQQQKAGFAALNEYLDTRLLRVQVRRLPLTQRGQQRDLGADGNRQVLRIAQAKGDRQWRDAIGDRLRRHIDPNLCKRSGRNQNDLLLAAHISKRVGCPHSQGIAPRLEVDTDVFPGKRAGLFQTALFSDLGDGHRLVIHQQFKESSHGAFDANPGLVAGEYLLIAQVDEINFRAKTRQKIFQRLALRVRHYRRRRNKRRRHGIRQHLAGREKRLRHTLCVWRVSAARITDRAQRHGRRNCRSAHARRGRAWQNLGGVCVAIGLQRARQAQDSAGRQSASVYSHRRSGRRKQKSGGLHDFVGRIQRLAPRRDLLTNVRRAFGNRKIRLL